MGRKRCPCEFSEIEPCRNQCSCRSPMMSGGCARCATYGSKEQQFANAKRLAGMDLQVNAYRKALQGVVEKFEESEPGREDFSVSMCEIAKNALHDTNETSPDGRFVVRVSTGRCKGYSRALPPGTGPVRCGNPTPCPIHPANDTRKPDEIEEFAQGVREHSSSTPCMDCGRPVLPGRTCGAC